jgi:hypothetical protein
MAARRAVGLFLMASLASGALRAAVRLVALRALGMAGFHLTQLLCVAAAARDQHGLWVMRQTTVTLVALLVPGAQRGAGEFLRVAVTTQRLPCLLQLESVRSMTLGAGEAAVKIFVRVSRLMTAAALEHGVEQVPGCRMRIMTADARVRAAELRVIGVNVGVAALARFFWRTAHVVRRMAARALVVRKYEGFAEHVHLRMAGATRERGGLLKLVRLMAGDALAVTGREQGGRRDERRTACVALGARGNRLGGVPMLMLVTGGAHLNRRFSARRMPGRNRSMTPAALSGLGAGIVVWAMTAHAATRRVHGDGRGVTLFC